MIDLIIPAYNAHDTIEYAIASVATQLGRDDIRVTVVDDCSDKPYAYLLPKFCGMLKDIQIVRMEENGGPGAARQFGIDNTDRPYIMFMDADDILINVAATRKLRAPLDKDKNVYLVSAGFYEEAENGNVVEHQNDLVWTFGKMYRRTYLQESKIGFNNTRANEDTGFHTKLRAVAKETDLIWFMPDFVYMWRFQPASITRINDAEYGHNKGFIGYIDNKIEALQLKQAHPQFVKEHSMGVLTECYRSYVSTSVHRAEFTETVKTYSRKFWTQVAREVYYGDTPFAREEIFKAFRQTAPAALPTVTVDQFIQMLEEME
jgi:glycosyltransferase involved in cell wall biosynthesis